MRARLTTNTPPLFSLQRALHRLRAPPLSTSSYDPAAAAAGSGGCSAAWAGGSAIGSASADHEIFAASWSLPGDSDGDDNDGGGGGCFDGGPVVDSGVLALSDGTPVSPLVWAPRLASPLGVPLQADGLRFVNRTATYRCRE